MSSTHKSLSASMPPPNEPGYKEVMSCMNSPPAYIHFLRTFGYPFVINHISQKQDDGLNANEIFPLLQTQAIDIQNQNEMCNCKVNERINAFGKILYKQNSVYDPYCTNNRTYQNHCDQYKCSQFCCDCLFDESLCDHTHRNAMINFLADRLEWIFKYDHGDALATFAQKLSRKYAADYPEYRLIESAWPAKNAAIYIYSLWLTTEYRNKLTSSGIHLEDYLPLQVEAVYPRSTPLADNIDHISSFIQVVESFPLCSVERLRAMEKLWIKEKNYYAGWELFSMYQEGAELFSMSRNFRWKFPPDQEKADNILRGLSYQAPSPSVQFLISPADASVGHYFPAELQKIKHFLQSIENIPPDISKSLARELEEYAVHSIDAKILYYNLCQKVGLKPNSSYFFPNKRWTYNAEIGDIIYDDERTAFDDLRCGALNGSWKCIEALLSKHSSTYESAFLITDLIHNFASSDKEKIPELFEKLLNCYESAYPAANWEDELLETHIANLELVRNHLHICQLRLIHSATQATWTRHGLLKSKCEHLFVRVGELIQRINTYDPSLSSSDFSVNTEFPPMDSSLPE